MYFWISYIQEPDIRPVIVKADGIADASELSNAYFRDQGWTGPIITKPCKVIEHNDRIYQVVS